MIGYRTELKVNRYDVANAIERINYLLNENIFPDENVSVSVASYLKTDEDQGLISILVNSRNFYDNLLKLIKELSKSITIFDWTEDEIYQYED